MANNEIKGGMIAKAQGQKAAKKDTSPSNRMRQTLELPSVKKILEDTAKSGKDELALAIINLYGNPDSSLQYCDAGEVFREAMKSVTVKLPLDPNLGFCYVVPRRKAGVWHAHFQIGYKGYIQMGIRSGMYKHINVREVYEGEFLGENKLTGMVDISGTPTSKTVVGYLSYFDTVTGYESCAYWTKEKVMDFASRKSDSYKASFSPWKTDFDKMAMKTVLKNHLCTFGPLSVEMQGAIRQEGTDDLIETTGREVEGEPDAEVIQGEAVEAPEAAETSEPEVLPGSAPTLTDSGESLPWELTGENGEVLHG